ncbi:MAG: hypothetical protein UT66_C0003G0057 [candidate division CPR2 bacterium GW2011_GWC1_39_9]|uniref:Uncharacterized protein n=1 Tax=candidate division CPR2 bacterium GW2011_GWC2_39_10 TaxID=1618345 RepID=A0A0G0PY08_UNCC2|nr:MAG: hypothetical protein UT18_C0011G0012 [candidate division CPR2 bacterium GW2011_GWC2_39_10]KKR36113.1 MAG: hypothetical protein UT66_C0003G0057 [candidate division CPR2 bacterium GW2011_GWC1_39_9]
MNALPAIDLTKHVMLNANKSSFILVPETFEIFKEIGIKEPNEYLRKYILLNGRKPKGNSIFVPGTHSAREGEKLGFELVYRLYEKGLEQVVVTAKRGESFRASDLELYHILLARKEGMRWSYYPEKACLEEDVLKTQSSLFFYFEKNDYAYFDEETVILCGRKIPFLRTYEFIAPSEETDKLVAVFEDSNLVRYGFVINNKNDYEMVLKFMEANKTTFWVELYAVDQELFKKLVLHPINLGVKTKGLL